MSGVDFAIVTSTDTLPLTTDPRGGGTYRLLSDTRGLGLPPVDAQFSEGAGEGGTYLGSRTLMREPQLEIRVYGADRADVERNLERLAGAFETGSGLPRLVATYETGEVYELPFVYLIGAEDAFARQSSDRQTTWVVRVRCPRPYWTAPTAITVTVRADDAAADLLSDLAAMPLGSSTALGVVTVDNPGSADAFADWRIVGPATAVRASINGVGFEVDAPLTEADVRVIDGRAATIHDAAGTPRYTEFGPAPKFPRLPPGVSTVTIEMDGSDPGTWEQTDTVLYRNRVTEPSLTDTAATWSTWSNGAGTFTHATSGFTGGPRGYLQIGWAATSAPHAAIMVDVDAAPGEFLTPQMTVWASRAQKVQAGLWFLSDSGLVIAAIFGPAVELPATTPVAVAIPGSIIGRVPAGAASARYSVSTFIPDSVPWQAGDVFRGSLAAVTDTTAVVPYFDGESERAEWTGDRDDSASVLYALELVGASEVSMSFRPRKRLVY